MNATPVLEVSDIPGTDKWRVTYTDSLGIPMEYVYDGPDAEEQANKKADAVIRARILGK